MATAPTLVSYTETSSWTTGATTKSTASVSWQAGDIVVVVGLNAGVQTLGVPTATGLTFTKAQDVAGSGVVCAAFVASAVAASSGSGAVTVTQSASNSDYGFGVWVWRGSSGIGSSVKQSTSTKTVNLTPAAADSAIVWGVSDFNADPLQTITPTPTDTRQRAVATGAYTFYAADLADQPSTSAVGYGISGGTGTGPFSIVALEIKGSTGSSPQTVDAPASVANWVVSAALVVVGAISLAAPVASSSWTAPAPSVTPGALSISAPVASATWTAPGATVTGGTLSITAPVATASWSALAPSVRAAVTRSAPVATAAWSALAPSIAPGALSVSAPAATATWTATAPSVTTAGANQTITAPVATATWIALAVRVRGIPRAIALSARVSTTFAETARRLLHDELRATRSNTLSIGARE